MWVEKIENGKGTRYKYSERFKHGNKYIKLSVTLNSNSSQAHKKAMQELRSKFQNKIKTAEKVRQEKVQTLTFSALCNEWYEYHAPSIKISTRKAIKNFINQILWLVGDELLFLNFTPAIAENIARDCYYKRQLSYIYSKSLLNTIKNVMRYAKKAKYIDDIAEFEAIELKKRPPTPTELEKKNTKFLTKTELAECFKQIKAKNLRIGLAMEFITLTGLRIGELLALRVIDYDKENSTISVNGTLLQGNFSDEEKRGTPKNIYSNRSVLLNDRAKQIIEWFILENKKAAKWSSKTYKDIGYIFTAMDGTPYKYNYIAHLLKKISIEGKKITSHIFRHTHISLLTEMNIPLKVVMQRVGHHDPNTTLQIYTHVTETMSKELENKIKALHF